MDIQTFIIIKIEKKCIRSKIKISCGIFTYLNFENIKKYNINDKIEKLNIK